MQKCLGGVGVGGRRETGLQLSAIFNVGYVLGTSLRKEAGNTTLECCFSLNMDAVNVDCVRHLVVTQGKTHSGRGPLEGFALKMEYTRKFGCQTKSWNTTRNKLLLGWVFLLEILIFFSCGGKKWLN